MQHGDRVLDIGCGTGLLLKHLNIPNYVGVDPSSKMLARLHEQYGADVDTRHCTFEDFEDGKFDLIVCL